MFPALMLALLLPGCVQITVAARDATVERRTDVDSGIRVEQEKDEQKKR